MAYAWVLDEAMRTSMDVALGVVTFLDGENEIKEESQFSTLRRCPKHGVLSWGENAAAGGIEPGEI